MPLPRAFNFPQPQGERHRNQRVEGAATPLPGGVTRLSEYFQIIETYARNQPWYFRGEDREYATTGLPNFSRSYVSRDGAPPEEDPETLELLIEPQRAANGILVYPSCMTIQEVEIVEEFRGSPPPDQYFDGLVGHDHDSAAWLAFAQHYDQPTRLLDVSRDPLVALYFACLGSPDRDGYVWAYPVPVAMHRETPPFREVFDRGTGDAGQQGIEAYRRDQLSTYAPVREFPPLDHNFLLTIPEPNERMIAQRGAFIWSPKPLMPLTQNAFNILINGNAKEDLLSTLRSFGIDPEGLRLG